MFFWGRCSLTAYAGLSPACVQGLEDRPPFLDFGPMPCGKRFGCLLFAGKGSAPYSASRDNTAGSANASTVAAASLAITSFDVRLGAYNPLQLIYRAPVPASSTVGMSGAAGKRVLSVTAKALTIPERTCVLHKLLTPDYGKMSPFTIHGT